MSFRDNCRSGAPPRYIYRWAVLAALAALAALANLAALAALAALPALAALVVLAALVALAVHDSSDPDAARGTSTVNSAEGLTVKKLSGMSLPTASAKPKEQV